MIRAYTETDADAVITIWLDASIIAHHFIDPSFWRAQCTAMRDSYLPASDVYVYTQEGKVLGFYALHDDNLAALFVAPAQQGQGIGSQLMAHAKQQRNTLKLAVYQENSASYKFYLQQGFQVYEEGIEPHTGHREYRLHFHGST